MSAPYTLDRALAFARLRFESRTHVIEEGRRASFADLDEETTRRARELVARGLARGGKVALRLSNSFHHLAAALAVWRAGGVLVPVNPRLTEEEEETICERAGVSLRACLDDGGTLLAEERSGDAPADAELAAIAYTSGTTGLPKGVEITHSNMLWSAAAVVHTRRDRDRAVAAMVSPICHLPVFVSHYLARLLSGGTVVAGAFDADRLFSLLADHGITDLPLVPAMVAPLLDRGSLPSGLGLRKVTVGSALTPMETKLALAERFPQAEIVEAYGQTESTDGLTMTV
ncbi:MAG: class I adenylate-forming enzyme family protein, partial [Candidatus Binatia bacterium]